MTKKIINIRDRIIGDGNSCFLVAEAGTTCNGEISIAKELIDVSAATGFDAIKFQTIWPEQISDKTITYRYKTLEGWREENMFEMFKQLTFRPEEWKELAEYAQTKNIIFFSTVDYLGGIEILGDCDVPIYKLGSWDVTYEPLIIRVAKKEKPVMLDLGPAYLSDIIRFIELCHGHGTGEIILMHDFHTKVPNEMNMRNIYYLKETFGVPVGFSAPDRNIELDIIAIATGANVIEKRITISRKLEGHHHVLCLEPDEIRSWNEKIRFAEAALGSSKIQPSRADISDSEKYYRSICTTRTIRKGEIFSTKNLDGKRPGMGIPTKFIEIFLGRKAKRDLKEDTLLKWIDM
jgi:sialic acid synthase SpsE